jgi:hypothetical protein
MNYFIFWRKHKFKILVLVSILFILFIYTTEPLEKGTFSTSYHYIPPTKLIIPQSLKESKGQAECRRVMEKVFECSFPTQRPLFLLNTITGQKLEIDCCNTEKKLGIEYHGIQHYKFVPYFHKTYDAFRNQQYRDEMKYRLCRENDFTLFVVPYTVPLEDIETYIMDKLRTYKYI